MYHSSRLFAAARPFDAAVLLAEAAMRQAVTPTARVQARLPARATSGGQDASVDGAFAREVARAFIAWKEG